MNVCEIAHYVTTVCLKLKKTHPNKTICQYVIELTFLQIHIETTIFFFSTVTS